MIQKDQYISCPKCGKQISSYALLCPHCTQRISQKDFGKTVKPPVDKEASSRAGSDHSVSTSGVNIFMLILIVIAAMGIYFKFQDQIKSLWAEKQPFAVSVPREDFDTICRDGLAKTMYFESQDPQKMHQTLEEYARTHGYPSRAALLQACAKATYHYFNGDQGIGEYADGKGIGEF